MREIDLASKLRNNEKVMVEDLRKEQDQGASILKQRIADLLDKSHTILKFRSLNPLNSTRDHFFNIHTDGTPDEYSMDD